MRGNEVIGRATLRAFIGRGGQRVIPRVFQDQDDDAIRRIRQSLDMLIL